MYDARTMDLRMCCISIVASGHIMAVYFLAEMHSKGIGLKRSCNLAVEVIRSSL